MSFWLFSFFPFFAFLPFFLFPFFSDYFDFGKEVSPDLQVMGKTIPEIKK